MNEAPGEPHGLTGRIVAFFTDSNFAILLVVLFLGMGAAALLLTPREEDPQIVVPFIDIHLEAPGASADETQRLAAIPLERLLYEIPGVEHVYSMTSHGHSTVTVRFDVGEDRERALVNVYNKIQSNRDIVPPQVTRWLVKPVEIDDVPILTITLYDAVRDDPELVRYADELATRLQRVADASRIHVHGGYRRQVRVLLDPTRLAAYQLTALDVRHALVGANRSLRAGRLWRNDLVTEVEIGPFFRAASEVEDVVVGARAGKPVQLRDVARVIDGPAEPETYTRIHLGPSAVVESRGDPVGEALMDGQGRQAVTISVAKRNGTNAVVVANRVVQELRELRESILPSSVRVQITRDYGQTANLKANDLIGSLMTAVFTIMVLLGAFLGWRSAWIVALAVPLTLSVTLFGDLLVGYTINRVTLFALILSLGLLVDDPIVSVENIVRHLSIGKESPRRATISALEEVLPPVFMANFTVIASFIPLFFITGMMGPYMAPMPFNVPVAELVSMGIAFTITPWAAYRLLKDKVKVQPSTTHGVREGALLRGYRGITSFLMRKRWAGMAFLGLIFLAFLGSLGVAASGAVPMKMLPFDNKSEFQIVVDAPEDYSLERTDRATTDLVRVVLGIPEVTNVVTYTGHASPHDFNGMVRHYFLRQGGNVADLRVNLLPRDQRGRQSHEILLSVRSSLESVATTHGVAIKLVEAPPGPPVLAGLVAEVRGPVSGTVTQLEDAAREVERRFRALPYLRDVDTYVASERTKLRYEFDRKKAAMRGVALAAGVETIHMALSGGTAGAVHAPGERLSLPLRLELARADRASEDDLLELTVRGARDELVPLAELIRIERTAEDRFLLRKDLQDVQYVLAEPVGKSPLDAVLALTADLKENPLPDGYDIELAGEGEWQVTVDVFRDMAIAFAAAMALIYILLVAQTSSFALSGLILLASPLTMIGIFPGFWLLNALFSGSVAEFEMPIFFTATGMIGMIALAGIVVRNSIILIDFIKREEAKGTATLEACIEAGVVRLRPILLTAITSVLGAWVIVFDPIFSGLAWSFVFGIVASTVFTVLVIPLVYSLTRSRTGSTPATASEEMS